MTRVSMLSSMTPAAGLPVIWIVRLPVAVPSLVLDESICSVSTAVVLPGARFEVRQA